jgi:hypothetical protein
MVTVTDRCQPGCTDSPRDRSGLQSQTGVSRAAQTVLGTGQVYSPSQAAEGGYTVSPRDRSGIQSQPGGSRGLHRQS